ncbi:hypothetical protein GCM10009863_63870 [Streptomyces axinellae]|uniref:Uncharacterized protein n=1 Tax=Streptomyces axinellae TaxID=552788 RepID=A0ABP6DAU5_9ACTN
MRTRRPPARRREAVAQAQARNRSIHIPEHASEIRPLRSDRCRDPLRAGPGWVEEAGRLGRQDRSSRNGSSQVVLAVHSLGHSPSSRRERSDARPERNRAKAGPERAVNRPNTAPSLPLTCQAPAKVVRALMAPPKLE